MFIDDERASADDAGRVDDDAANEGEVAEERMAAMMLKMSASAITRRRCAR